MVALMPKVFFRCGFTHWMDGDGFRPHHDVERLRRRTGQTLSRAGDLVSLTTVQACDTKDRTLAYEARDEAIFSVRRRWSRELRPEEAHLLP